VLPGRILLAIGMVLAITPLTTVNLSAVKSAHSGIAAAIQNATGRTSALIAVACVGVITANRMTDASFARLVEVSALLFFVGAVVGGLGIRNPAVSVAEPVPDETPRPLGVPAALAARVLQSPANLRLTAQ
jgi:hypothetical protein